MTLRVAQGIAVFGTAIRIERLPFLLEEFFRRYPGTIKLEESGREWREAGFDEAGASLFVIEVCRWGGYAGIARRVLNDNAAVAVAAAFRQANAQLTISPPDHGAALSDVNALRGLGTPSFASKHLRFLRPDLCPVFDSVLHNVLPYPFDSRGYAAFASDCVQLARIATEDRTINPHPSRPHQWLAADVEAALFCQVQGWAA